jgi:hypothetical protein
MTISIGPCSKNFNPWGINNGAAMGATPSDHPWSLALVVPACRGQSELGRGEALMEQPL